MNILELDSYNLADAVKFNEQLNPRIWQRNQMRPEVRTKLLEIAEDFKQSLGLTDLNVKDITLSGSNAGYTYTPHSDIDLHLVVDLPEADASDVYRELFDAKKFQYNETHSIKIGGYDVELYVENANTPPVSQGMFSVLRNDWINIPLRKRSTINDTAVKSKYNVMQHRIESAIQSRNLQQLTSTVAKIKKMRQTGLAKHGELGPENLAYKMLRSQGVIKQLYDARTAAKDQELSLRERTIQVKQPFRYGFRTTEDVSSNPSGVSPETKMFLSEKPAQSQQEIVTDFVNYCVEQLGIEQQPTIKFKRDPEWSARNKTFGRYNHQDNLLEVSLAGRHVMDILRTVAHELTHQRQHEVDDVPDTAGETGSAWENQANAQAGVLMRDYAEQHPEFFSDQPEERHMSESSGYIPTKKQARDPRFSMALTRDVRPGAVGREANKLNLHTDAQGQPALLMKTANLREDRMPQPSQGSGKYRDLNEPLGPETPPTMPAGTVRVDVSDVYDWYKLGTHISNMKGLGKHDFGAGPPSTIISFGDEDTEHKFIQDLKRTGLDVTDIDPKDPKQPAGMPKIKTDPTYNVDEDIVASLRQEFALLEEEFLGEINMSPSNLRVEAAKTGAIAGMEFEMIVPNVENDDDDMIEHQDERCRSIDDAVQFFHDGDFNSRRDVERLRERMQNDFYEWLDDKIRNDWDRDGEDFVRDWVANNVDDSEWRDLISDELDEQEAFEQFVGQVHGDPNNDYYQQAYDAYREDNDGSYDESDWLDAEDLDRMSGVENAYEISWPHYTSGGGEANIEDVAQEFENAVGRDTKASGSYHSGSVKRPGPSALHYVVEPDGSLDGDNPGDTGLEFVSPPLSIDEILSDLNKVKAWAKEYGCYTNDSTGLHINISVPNYSRENLDFVKLALLMGDKYVLESFGRAGNTYAKSALDMVRDRVRNNPDDAARLLDKMKGNLDSLASKAIHSGITQKYTSINTKDGHIEFRSPGGDWLDENFDQIENTLLRFTVAMSAALDPAAYRKEYLTKLYKLLSEGMNKSDTDVIQLFSNYSAGELDKAALIRQVRQKQLARDVSKGKATGKMWWRVTNPANSMASINVVAASKEQAIATAVEPANYPDWARVQNTLQATPLRPYEEPKAPSAADNPGNWGIWIGASQRFARQPGEHPAGQEIPLRRFTSQEAAEQYLAQARSENPRMRTDVEVREIEPAAPVPGSTLNLQRQRAAAAAQPAEDLKSYNVTDATGYVAVFQARNPNAAMQAAREQMPDRFRNIVNVVLNDRATQAAAPQTLTRPGQGQQTFTGEWQVLDPEDREIYRFSGVGNNQSDANRVAMNWMRQNPGRMQAGVTVVPVMSETA